MLPEEWPIAAPAADQGVSPARHAGRDRLATVRRDFFLDPEARLTEQERALMTVMLHSLVADVADELRAFLPAGSAVANDDNNPELVAQMSAARLLDIPDLIHVLLCRADEEQVAGAIRARSGRRDGRFLQALVSDEDASISAAAMALILARGRRRDRFGQMRIEFDDLPPDVAAQLAHAVAAALRGRVHVSDTAAADRQLAAASAALLARHDPGKRLGTLCASLVRLLDEAGRLDEELVASAAEEGEIGVVIQALARRAAIGSNDAADLLLAGSGDQLILLLRLAAVSRDFAARLLAGPGDLLGMTDPVREIGLFDSLSQDNVDAAREWLRLDPAYRSALGALGQANGQRTY